MTASQEKEPVIFNVDLWATDIHKEEIGFFKDEKRGAKERQWTQDSEPIGKVERDGKEFGLLALREKEWTQKDPLKRKLVIKAFTPSDYWRGSIELLVGKSIMLSQVSHEAAPVFLVNYDSTDYVARIQKVPHKRAFRGDVWGFEVVMNDNIVKSYEIDDNRFTLGDDFYIKDINDNEVAAIDGKLLNIGKRFEFSIFKEKLASEKIFYITGILFTAVLKYMDDIRDLLKEVLKKLKEGESLSLTHNELELYHNPRSSKH